MLSLFQQTTFVNGITFFSNEIYTQGKKGNSAERLARIGTLLLGIAATLGATSSMFMWKYIKRTHFILISEIIMAASLGLSGIFALVGSQAGIITFTLVHMFAFSWGFGPTLWIYCSEVLDSFGFSVIGVINMFSIWTFATFANLLFKFFTPPGMYFGLVVVQIVCILFVWKCVRETMGKTKEELEKLYSG